MKRQNGHRPVLFSESIESLNLHNGQIIVDATLGGGGHSWEIAQRIAPDGLLIAVDKDAAAIERCEERFSEAPCRSLLVKSDFREIRSILKSAGIEKVDGIIADLGVSSFQLEEGSRGFSYNQDARLDMRMDKDACLSAYEVVNNYTEANLTRIFRDFGEEKWSSRIARFIIEARKDRPVETTLELVEIIKNAIPASARRNGPHPAKRVFQALRIEVNSELSDLDIAVEDFADSLRVGGRLAVITFHSLEDRVVKQAYRKLFNPCTCPPGSPVCTCGNRRKIDIITRKPIVPSEEELEYNPRARSAKLRVLEKTED